jgi:hypothetical protein
MDNALYQLRQFENSIQMRNIEHKLMKMNINTVYEYIDTNYTNDDRLYIKDAYQAIIGQDLLDWFKNYDPPNGFMLASTPELTRITSAMKLIDHHSGASYALTMRAVQNIVRNSTH